MDFSVLIMRLSPFKDVVKSMTHQFLYGECRQVLDDAHIDFAFLPSSTKTRDMNNGIRSLRQKRNPLDFDLILISNSYAAELINLPWMLKASGIPFRSSKRREYEQTVLSSESANTNTENLHYPLIIMGGSNALASQAILYDRNDAMVDALYFGEGEENIAKIVRSLVQTGILWRRKKLDILQSEVTGLKVFGAEDTRIQKAIYTNTNYEQLASAQQAEFDSPEATTARLMITYGCHAFCTFCHEGWERKPYREIPVSELIPAARHLREKTGADTLEITAFNFNTYTDITQLIKQLNKMYAQVNFMSQRADILAANKNLATFEAAMGKRQYTIGVEGISERMRLYFNKNLTQETIFQSMTLMLKEKSTKEIKLFYILSGLETASDFADLKQFLASIEELKLKHNTGVRILCSFGLLVRMPFTPLRYEKLILTEEEWAPVLSSVKQIVESAGYEFRLTYPFEEYFLSQTLVMTNHFLAPLMEQMANAGHSYNKEFSKGAWEFFKANCPDLQTDLPAKTAQSADSTQSAGNPAQSVSNTVQSADSVQSAFSAFTAEKDANWPFAFDFVDCKISDDFLYKRFISAKKSENIPSCAAMNEIGNGKCGGCGSCTAEQRDFLENHFIDMPKFNDILSIEEQVKEKAKAKPLFLIFDIPEQYKHACEQTREALIMRSLFQQMANGVETVMTVKDILFNGTAFLKQLPDWYGQTLYQVYPFSNAIRSELIQTLSNVGYQVMDKVPDISKMSFNFDFFPPTITSATTAEGKNKQRKELETIAGKALDFMHLPYILSRNDGNTILTIVPKALKKHVISACVVTDDHIFFTGTQKADFSVFITQRYFARTTIIT